MITALTRAPGPELARCVLTHLARQPIDPDRALAQHRAYQAALRNAGVRVIELPADPALPDGVFVEDTAVVLDEVAVLTSPTPRVPARGTGRGRGRARPLPPARPAAAGYVPGGRGRAPRRADPLRRAVRPGRAGPGSRRWTSVVRPFGYSVVPVRVTGCLHLKSAACAVDEETVLVNRAWVETGPFSGLRLVDVPAAEPFGANVLRLPGAVLVSSAYPATAELVRGLGHRVVTLDVSELHKAESGLTCMSLVFTDHAGAGIQRPT